MKQCSLGTNHHKRVSTGHKLKNYLHFLCSMIILLDLLHSDQGKKPTRFYRQGAKLLFFHWELAQDGSIFTCHSVEPMTQSAINADKCCILCLDVYIHICKTAFSKKNAAPVAAYLCVCVPPLHKLVVAPKFFYGFMKVVSASFVPTGVSVHSSHNKLCYMKVC